MCIMDIFDSFIYIEIFQGEMISYNGVYVLRVKIDRIHLIYFVSNAIKRIHPKCQKPVL